MSGVDVLAVMDRAVENLQDAGVIGNTIGLKNARSIVSDVLVHGRLLTDSLADGTDSRAHFIALTGALARATGGSDGR